MYALNGTVQFPFHTFLSGSVTIFPLPVGASPQVFGRILNADYLNKAGKSNFIHHLYIFLFSLERKKKQKSMNVLMFFQWYS
jgi:hypothetical protein